MMRYLLDTNIVSQQMVDRPDISAARFLQATPQDLTYISVMTLMEIRAGIERLDGTSGKRKRLEHWLLHRLPKRFQGRIVPVTAEIADRAGQMLTAERTAKRTPDKADLLIAATATVHEMEVVTLNRKHFESLGVQLVDIALTLA